MIPITKVICTRKRSLETTLSELKIMHIISVVWKLRLVVKDNAFHQRSLETTLSVFVNQHINIIFEIS